MHTSLKRTVSGVLSFLLVGQVMIFGDGTAQGVLHKDTLVAAAGSIEEMKNARQLKEEYDTAIEGLGEVDYFTLPSTGNTRRRVRSVNRLNTEETSTESSVWDDVTITEEPINAPDTLTVSGYVEKGTVPNHTESDSTPIYIRVFNGNWEEIASVQANQNGSYTVTASGSDVYHVKFECDGYLPFYLRDFGTGSYKVSSDSSNDVNKDTIILIPGDTTYNADNGNLWSDDKLTAEDAEYVWEHVGSQIGDPDFNPTMDINGDGVISEEEKHAFSHFYDDLINTGGSYDMSGWSVLTYDIDLNGVINEHDYDLLYDMVYNGLSTSGWHIPDFVDGTPTESDLQIFREKVDASHIVNTDVYIYNHEFTADVVVDGSDFNTERIEFLASLRGPVGEYIAYMDRNSNGVIEETEAQWFSAAYSIYGDVEWDKASAEHLLCCRIPNSHIV